MNGQSNFCTTINVGPSGPPFPINSAENGTSIDPASKRVVLGQNYGEAGDPGAIINNREIPLLNAAELTIGASGAGPAYLVINSAFNVVALGIDVNNVNTARIVFDQSQAMSQVVAASKISLLCGTGIILLDTPVPASSGSGEVLLRNNAGGANDSRIESIQGVSGSFTTADGKTVTVTRGVITAIV